MLLPAEFSHWGWLLLTAVNPVKWEEYLVAADIQLISYPRVTEYREAQ